MTIDEVQSNSQSQLFFVRASFAINLSVNNGVNKFRANGMAREIEINLSASEALTKDEAEAVNEYTKQVDALLNTFHLDKSLLQKDVDTLQRFVGESNEFISTDITLTHEYHNPAILDESLGNSFREIQISSGGRGALQVFVNEESMSYKYYENVVEELVPPPPYDRGFNVPGSDYIENHEYNSAGGDPDFYNEAVTDSINREISPMNHYAQTYLG